jgi:hypothetical protein
LEKFRLQIISTPYCLSKLNRDILFSVIIQYIITVRQEVYGIQELKLDKDY